MGQIGSWLWKSLLIGGALALLTWAGFYFFFKIHQELNVPPGFAGHLGLFVFFLGALVSMVYFRMRR
jgi:hypothetical protein